MLDHVKSLDVGPGGSQHSDTILTVSISIFGWASSLGRLLIHAISGD